MNNTFLIILVLGVGGMTLLSALLLNTDLAAQHFPWFVKHEIVTFLGVVAITGSIAIGTFLSLQDGSAAILPASLASDAGRYVNDDGGYAFRPPAGWSVSSPSDLTRIESPDGNITMRMRPAGDGDIKDLSRPFAQTLTSAWTAVQAERQRRATVGDAPAISISGTGTDASGEPRRFLAIVLNSGGRNYSIAVVVPQTLDTSQFQEIDQTVSSFAPVAGP